MERKDFRIRPKKYELGRTVVELYGTPSEVELIKDALTIYLAEQRKNELLGLRQDVTRPSSGIIQDLLDGISQPNHTTTPEERQLFRARERV